MQANKLEQMKDNQVLEDFATAQGLGFGGLKDFEGACLQRSPSSQMGVSES